MASTDAGLSNLSLATYSNNTFYSTFFNGSTDYLTISSNAVFAFGTGDFTVEWWWYLNTAFSASNGPGIGQKLSDTTGGWVIYRNGTINTTVLSLRLAGQSGASNTDYACTAAPIQGVWEHWAVVRSSGTVTWYKNGVASGSTASVTTNVTDTNTAAPMYVGFAQTWSYYNHNSYISNLRILKGTALYTTSFNPPTAQLTAIANTALLTCNTNSFVDGSVNNFTITRVGNTGFKQFTPLLQSNASVTLSPTFSTGTTNYTFSAPANVQAISVTPTAVDPALATIKYNGNVTLTSGQANIASTAPAYTSGYSANFTGGILQYANASQINTNGYSWTIELWFYPTGNYANYNTLFAKRVSASGTTAYEGYCRITTGVISFYNGTNYESGYTLTANTWSHVAYTYDGSQISIYVNGNKVYGAVVTITDNTEPLTIGGARGYTEWTLGNISNFRMVKGYVIYTGNFTPPTSPLSLTQSTGTNIRAITTNGYSVFFNGTTDYFTMTGTSAVQFGSGDFTFEAYVYTTSGNFTLYSDRSGATFDGLVFRINTLQLYINISTSGSSWAVNGSIGSGAINSSTWNHVAICRSGTNILSFINGVLVGTTSIGTASIRQTSNVKIGQDVGGGGGPFSGYISNLRIVKGTALYTTNFTLNVSTPLENIANTGLLLFRSSLSTDDSNNYTLTTVGTPRFILNNGPFNSAGAASTQFLSTALAYQQVSNPYVPALSLGQGHNNFTAETWVYLTALPPTAPGWYIIQKGVGSTPGLEWSFSVTSTGLYFQTTSGIPTGTTTSTAFTANITYGQWMHLALTKTGTSVNVWFNGFYLGTVNGVNNLYYNSNVASYITIANTQTSATTAFSGFINNARVVYGKALYTVNYDAQFTPPTTVNLTQSLTSTIASIDNASSYVVNNGSSVYFNNTNDFLTFPEPASYFYSAYFNGTSQYLTMPSNTAGVQMGSSDFTIECWIYPTTTGSPGRIINNWSSSTQQSASWEILQAGGGVQFNCSTSGTTSQVNLNGGGLYINGWNHLAGVRIGNVFTLYMNGVSSATTTQSITLQTADTFTIGARNNQGSYFEYFAGYISNVRIIKGTGLYTTGFTPSTIPLTTSSQGATSNQVSFLSLQNNTIKDNSSSALTITNVGTVTISQNHPFILYGDGTNVTVEAWVLLGAAPTTRAWIINNSATSTGYFGVAIEANRTITVWSDSNATAALTSSFNPALQLYQWNHIAVTFVNGNIYIYVNGVRDSNTFAKTTIWQAATLGTVYIGRQASAAAQYFPGYITNLRMVYGTAVYTGKFTVPTTPLTAITNTVFLGLQSSVTLDSSTNNITITKGSGATGLILSPLTSPFSTYIPTVYNGYSTGYGWQSASPTDYAVVTTGYATALFLSGDFTVESWIYLASTPASYASVIDTRSTGADAWVFGINSLKLDFYYGSAGRLTGTTSLSINTWYHIAATRQNGLLRIWINGVLEASTTYTTEFAGRAATTARIGAIIDPAYFNGYLSNTRLINGTAIYTGPFIPSTTPYSLTSPASTNTLAVTGITTYPAVGNPNGVNYSGSFHISGVAAGTSSTSVSFQIANVNNGRFEMNTYDFTIEAWFYCTSITSATYTILSLIHTNGTEYSFNLYLTKTSSTYGTIGFQAYFIPSTTLFNPIYTGPINSYQWYHVSAVRIGTTFNVYLNGTLVITNSIFASFPANQNFVGTNSTAPVLGIGVSYAAASGFSNPFLGYISNVRIIKGYGVYTGNFSPSISPLSNTQPSIINNNAITGTATSLLTLQNSTTTDASTNNLTLTATGSPTLSSTIVPYLPGANGYSFSFNPTTSDTLTISGNKILNLGSLDFTVESWVYLNALPTSDAWPTDYTLHFVVIGVGTPSAGDGFNCMIGQTKLLVQMNDVGYVSTNVHNMAINTWYHIAYVRINNIITFYVNGVSIGSVSSLPAVGTGSNTYIGSETAQGAYFNGYMSNLRVVRALGVYTGNFTVPTVGLSVTQSSGTNISAIVSNSTYYYSFSGSSSYLTTPSTTNFVFPASTDFTIEFWFNSNNAGAGSFVGNADSSNNGWTLWYNGSGQIQFQNFGLSIHSTSLTVVAGVWYHYALVRIGTTINSYVNGISQTPVTNSTSFTQSTVTMAIGYNTGSVNANYFNGFISNLRIVKGVGVYTGSFTMPIGPLSVTQSSGTNINAITSGQTVLLTCQSVTIVDNSSSPITLTNIGGVSSTSTLAIFSPTKLLMFQSTAILSDVSINGYIPTITGSPTLSPANMTYSPFVKSNGQSVRFTGSSQYITAPSNAVFTFGTNDFTIEGWIYIVTGITGTLFDNRTGSTTISSQIYIQSNIINYAVAGTSVISGATLSYNTWYHIAVVRISNVTKLYVNGIQSGSSYTDNNNYVIGSPYMGTGYNSSNPLNGYISNLRVVNGTGVYPNNFVVPITPLTSTLSSSTPITSLSNVIPSLGNSVYFNGANDYMKVPSTVTSFGTGNFTIETYYYPTSFAAVTTLFGQYTAATTSLGYWNVQVTTAGIITVYYNGSTNFTASTAILINEWVHIALVRISGTITLYVNGVSYGTINFATQFGLTSLASPLYIGATQLSGPTQYALGYMSNLRIVKGVGVYTGAFTVPTSPLSSTQSSGTNIVAITGSGTSLLLYQNSPFTDNSTYNNTVLGFGNPQYSPVFSPSYFSYPTPVNGNSGYFNGSSTYLSLTQPSNASTNDFTIELWVYPTSVAAIGYLLSTSTTTTNCYHLWIGAGGSVNLAVDSATASIVGTGNHTPLKTNMWAHIAIVRTNGVIFTYIDGYRSLTGLVKTTQFGDTGTLNIGRYQPTPGQYFTGFITNVRFVYGTAIYTDQYSIPPYKNPLTSVTNTTLLLLQTTQTKDNSTNNVTVTNNNVILSTYTNPYTMMQLPVLLTGQNTRDVTSTTGFRDNSMYNVTVTSSSTTLASHQPAVGPFGITPVLLLNQNSSIIDNSINNFSMSQNGTPGIMQYVTPFSSTGNSITFNGSSQYVTGINLYNSLGGDFTIEFFMNSGPQTATVGGLILGGKTNYSTTNNNNYYIMCSSPTGYGKSSFQTIQIYNSLVSTTAPVFVGSTPVCDSKWHHIAIVRISNIVTVYIDGVIDPTPLNNFTNTGIWDYSNYTIGSNPSDGTYSVANLAYNGMLSNMRIINGVGTYTGTFTIPTSKLTTSQSSGSNIVAFTSTVPSTTGYSWIFNSVASSYVTISPAPTLNFGTNDYTIEFWHYLTGRPSTTTYPCFFSNYNSYTTGSLSMFAGHGSSDITKYQIAFNGYSFPSNALVSIKNIIYGKWTHIAVVRRSGTVYLYINGILDSSSFYGNYNVYSNNNSWYIGGTGDATNASFISGLISNFRVVNGIGIYSGTNITTANFTVPTSVLTTTQSSGTNISALSTSLVANGGAVWYYGGTQLLNNITHNLTLNASLVNFTVEAWVWLTIMPTANSWTSGVFVVAGVGPTLSSGTWFVIGSSNIFMVVANTLYGGFNHNMVVSTWYHLAYVVSNNTLTFYVNGISVGSSISIPSTMSTTNAYRFEIGMAAQTSGYDLRGYISNLRVLKSTALYTSNFTPSTSPLTNTQNAVTNINQITGTSTSLLALQNTLTGDNSTNGFTLTAGGSVSVNSTVYPSFTSTNGYSAYMQAGLVAAQNSSVTIPSTGSISGTGTFTAECWIYPLIFTTTYQVIIASDTSGGLTAFGIYPNGTIFYGTSLVSIQGTTPTSNTVTFNSWNHLALVRDSSSTIITIYINGIQSYTGTNTTNYTAGVVRIGTDGGGTNYPFTGYISNVRFTNGITVYTTSFTPPTSYLTTTQTANTNGSPSSVLAINTYAASFNGSNQYLTLPNTNQFVFGNNNFTIEFYMYPFTASQSNILIDFRPSGVNGAYPCIYLNGGPITYYVNTANQISGSTPPIYTWTHIALVRNNGITTIYFNGVSTGSTYTDNNTYILGTSAPVIGGNGYSRGASIFNGYISNLRIVNGSAIYTGTFTTPTSQLSTTQNVGTNISAIVSPTTSNGYYSNYFTNSTGQYLSLPGAPFVFGTNAFTVECWVYTLSLASTQTFVDNWVNTTFVTGQWTLYMNATTGYVSFSYATGTATQTYITTTIAIPIGRWTHVAAVRTNTSTNGFAIYLGGLLAQTATLSASIGVNQTSSIGILTSNKTLPMFGFISNVRLTNGVAVYTGIFLPQSSPLTTTQSSVTTVQSNLLALQNSTTTDASTNNFTLTATNSPTRNIFSPFPVTNGSSVYFNGSSYLNVPSSSSSKALYLNNSDYTIELWVYTTNITNNNFIFANNSLNNDNGYQMQIVSGQLRFGGNSTYTSVDASVLLNSWTHIAWVRINGVETLYFNGTLVATVTRLLTFTQGDYPIYIGIHPAQSIYFTGYISNFRINRIGIYTGNFTPSLSPLTLTQSSGTNISAITGVVPTNGSSVSFASSAYLSTVGNSQLAFADAQFTIEFWMYVTSVTTVQYFYDLRGATASNLASYIWINTNAYLYYGVGSSTTIITSNTTVSASIWYHIAVVRTNQSGSGVTMYINGVFAGSGTDANTHSQFGLRIGQTGAGASPLTGNISNFRILGTALYTSGFPVPSQPLTAITTTKILVLQNSTTSDASTNNFTLTATGTPTLSTTLSPFIYTSQLLMLQNSTTSDASANALNGTVTGTITLFPIFSPFVLSTGYSVYFNGSNQYINAPSNSAFTFGTGDFTIEGWIYLTTNTITGTLYDGRTSTNSVSPRIYINLGTLYYAVGNTNVITGITLNSATWYHIAVVRNYGSTSLYVNGVQTSNIYADSNNYVIGSPYIGTGYNNTNSLNGYITNIRVIKGFANYYNNFVVPVIPLIATTSGNVAQISALTTTNGYYAYSFNGTNQYLTLSSNSIFTLSNGAFTIECWVFIAGNQTQTFGHQIIGTYPSTGNGWAWVINRSNLGPVGISWYNGSLTAVILSYTTYLNVGQWYHIAVVRTSTSTNGLVIYLNGSSVATGTDATNDSVLQTLYIGSQGTSNCFFPGFISNLRLTKGVAVYTGNFTVPTGPLTATQSSGTNISAITGTSVSLLTCQSLTIIDNSTYSTAITNTGTVTTNLAFTLFNNNGPALLTSQSSTIIDNSSVPFTITNTGAVVTSPVINLYNTNVGVLETLTLQNSTITDTSFNTFTITNNNSTTMYPAPGLFNTALVQLLVLQSSLIIDRGYYGLTLSPVGKTQLDSKSPFSTTNGKSIFFNGTNQYLSAPSDASFTFGTGDFTIEGWIYLTGSTTTGTLYDSRTGLSTVSPQIYINNNIIYYAVAGSNVITGSTINPITWYHVAVVRVSGVTKLWVNGIQSGSSYTDTNNYVIGSPYIGQGYNSSYPLTGYISNVRVVKGTGVYLYNFTVPTTTLTSTQSSVASTKALVGLATSGYYSAYMDGYNSYISFPQTNIGPLAFISWTIESWVYFTNYPNSTGSYSIALFSTVNTGNTTGFVLNFSGTATSITGFNIFAYSGFGNINSTFNYNFSLATWYHVAVTKTNSGTFTVYINGINLGSITQFCNWVDNTTYYIGYNGNGTNPWYFPGFISNFRITLGQVNYITGFVPSTIPLSATQNNNINGNPSLAIARSTNTGYYNYVFTGSTSQYLSLPSNGFVFGTNPFTVECWVYPTQNTAVNQLILDNWLNNTSGSYVPGQWNLLLYFTTTTSCSIYANFASSVSAYTTFNITNTGIQANNWYHIAMVRSSTSTNGFAIYVNGAPVVIGTVSMSVGAVGTSAIGVQKITSTNPFYGYISNIRFTYGVALYSGSFVPQTTPLTNTQTAQTPTASALLSLQNSTTTDASTNNLTLTATGSPTVSSSVVPTFPVTNGYSVRFNSANTDNFNISGNTLLNFVSQDFTVESWVYLNTMPTSDAWPTNYTLHFVVIGVGTQSAADGFNCMIGQTKLLIHINDVGYVSTNVHNMVINTWYHIAYVRISNTLTFYVNGVSIGSVSSLPAVGTGNNTWIGSETAQGAYFNGYMSNLRVVKALGVYTGNFTVPTSPLTTTQSSGTNISAISAAVAGTSGTQLLLFQNSLVVDNSVNNFSVTIYAGKPQLNTTNMTYMPFVNSNGKSVYFTGVTQYINAPSNSVYTFGTSDFTIEGWIYLASGTSGTLYDSRTGLTTVSTQIYISSNTIYFAVGNTVAITGVYIALSTWYHVSVVRISGVTKLYVNGIQAGSNYTDANSYVLGSPYIGTGYNSSNPLNGYISNLRVINGTGLYTSQFTVPIAPLTANAVSSVITPLSAPTTSNGYYTTVHTGLTTQYLSVPGAPFVFGTSAFTIECWVYVSTFSNTPVFIDNWTTGPSGSYTVGTWQLFFNTTGTLQFSYPTSASAVSFVTTTSTVVLNTWTHVAAVRTSTSTNGFVIYINGVAGVTGTISASLGINSTSTIGAQTYNKAFPLNGFISNIRITNLAVYTGAFTPPTGPLAATQSSGTNIAAITGTSVALLTCQSSTIIDNSTFAYTITNVGAVATSVAFGLFNNSTGVSLLTAQNSTFVDNSVNGVTITNSSTPVTTAQVYGLFNTSLTSLLAFQTSLLTDASINNITLSKTSNVYLEKSFSAFGNSVPSLLTAQSGLNTDNSTSLQAVNNYYANTSLFYQTTVTPYGIQTPTTLLTAQANVLISDAANNYGTSTFMTNTGTTIPVSTVNGPFNNDVALLAFQNSLITDYSNNRTQLTIVGAGVSPTDNSPFSTSKSLTSLLIPYGYNDLSINNTVGSAYIANNANVAQTNFTYNPVTIPSSLVSVLALQTSNILLDGSINNVAMTTLNTAPTSNTLSPFGTYYSNGLILLNTQSTTGLYNSNTTNYANLLVTAGDGVTTNAYSINVTSLNNIGNIYSRDITEIGYRSNYATSLITLTDVANSNLAETTANIFVGSSQASANSFYTTISVKSVDISDKGIMNIAPSNATFIITDVQNSNLAETIYTVNVSGVTTKIDFYDYGITNTAPNNTSFFISDVANSNLAETIANVVIGTIKTYLFSESTIGSSTISLPSPVGGTVLFPTYSYTDGVPISANNVSNGTGSGGSFASNTQIWYQT